MPVLNQTRQGGGMPEPRAGRRLLRAALLGLVLASLAAFTWLVWGVVWSESVPLP
jgi:hypothetical protein